MGLNPKRSTSDMQTSRAAMLPSLVTLWLPIESDKPPISHGEWHPDVRWRMVDVRWPETGAVL